MKKFILLLTLIFIGYTFTLAFSQELNNTLYVPGQYPTIQSAIDAASDGDEIVVAPGTYLGEGNVGLNMLGKAIHLRSQNGPEDTIIDCELQKPFIKMESGETRASIVEGFQIIRANHIDPSDPLYAISCAGSSPTIRNCIISDGLIGAIGIEGGSPLIEKCLFLRNSTMGNGGAIYAKYVPELQISDSSFSENHSFWGGAIYAEDMQELQISQSSFSKNHSTWGGAIYAPDVQELQISQSSFSKNYSESGGAIHAKDGSGLQISYSSFSENHSDWGGAIYAISMLGLQISNCLFLNNFVLDSAGAMYMDNLTDFLIEESYFFNNSAINDDGANGGALYIINSNGVFKNSIFVKNKAYDGGALRLITSWDVDITQCTIADNIATNVNHGGGVWAYDSEVSVTNSILWNNSFQDLGNQQDTSTFSVNYSNVEEGAQGMGNMSEDPGFKDPRGNDYHLRSDSPCINAGLDLTEYQITTDIDGEARPNGEGFDIGADESYPLIKIIEKSR